MKTPELEKMKAVQPKSQVIGEFLEWLTGEKEITLAKWSDHDTLMPVHEHTEKLLAEFFGINLVKVEREKRMILEDLRKKG
jgi:hypothetical protein